MGAVGDSPWDMKLWKSAPQRLKCMGPAFSQLLARNPSILNIKYPIVQLLRDGHVRYNSLCIY
eukprot:762665-Hanusia_phi.AAC.4